MHKPLGNEISDQQVSTREIFNILTRDNNQAVKKRSRKVELNRSIEFKKNQ